MDVKVRIPIKNVYYMLCYAWNIVDYSDVSVCGSEEFDEIYNLLCRMLLKEVKRLLKRGFYKQYVEEEDALMKLRGQIDFTESIHRQTMRNNRMYCKMDDFSSNILFNQIIKSTLIDFLKYPRLDKALAIEIRNTVKAFPEIDYIEVSKRHFGYLKFNRNNLSYQIIINICMLFKEGLIANKDDKNLKFLSFVDEQQMNKIYEKFILNFYKVNLIKDIKVYNPKIKWDIDEGDNGTSLFPQLQTDVVLENHKLRKQMIIDAKYNQTTLVSRFSDSEKTIRSQHLYQIYTYMSMSKYDGEISGVLLYPKTGVYVDETKTIHNQYKTSFKTLDLNANWEEISQRLMSIADGLLH